MTVAAAIQTLVHSKHCNSRSIKCEREVINERIGSSIPQLRTACVSASTRMIPFMIDCKSNILLSPLIILCAYILCMSTLIYILPYLLRILRKPLPGSYIPCSFLLCIFSQVFLFCVLLQIYSLRLFLLSSDFHNSSYDLTIKLECF